MGQSYSIGDFKIKKKLPRLPVFKIEESNYQASVVGIFSYIFLDIKFLEIRFQLRIAVSMTLSTSFIYNRPFIIFH